MTDILDTISPPIIGEDRIHISVDYASLPITVGRPITLLFDYAKTKPAGVVKPLKLQVSPAFGDGTEYMEVTFDLFVPNSYAIQLEHPGQYLVVIREVFHNLWQGRLLIDVLGDEYQDLRSNR